ncbi:HvfC/BufC family peptide modification chaperone [Erythrobacter sp. Alg231-14]|uniref:HvfC/BufC family peptide modification chaperone n=1 Tax=Erythrobacter sp. Alg231-14 TaxID=1922225 RepID=UPI000D55CFBF
MTGASTSLAQRQADFLRAILDDAAPLPEGWSNRQTAGMAVYRGNYRAALLGSLTDTYERTARYAGDQPFAQASINHVIKHPPTGWTLDDAGVGFDATCAQFFGQNPEISELAWLERAMLDLATAPDTTPMDPAAFGAATAAFGDAEWEALRLEFGPRATCRLVEHDLAMIWRSLGEDAPVEGDGAPLTTSETNGYIRPNAQLSEAQACIVWREGERPTFIMAQADHVDAFAIMQEGATYADLIGQLIGDDLDPSPESVHEAAMRAGAILGQWLQEGIITGINP